jgi:hypothetical protein
MITLQPGTSARSVSAASRPVIPGISISSSATSGPVLRTASSTSSPRETWETTEMSCSSSSSVASAPRTIAWSSAINTRISGIRDRH